MQDQIEADYLVDKLAGRLEKYTSKNIPIGKMNILKELVLANNDNREETLAEYRKRKEQSE